MIFVIKVLMYQVLIEYHYKYEFLLQAVVDKLIFVV